MPFRGEVHHDIQKQWVGDLKRPLKYRNTFGRTVEKQNVKMLKCKMIQNSKLHAALKNFRYTVI